MSLLTIDEVEIELQRRSAQREATARATAAEIQRRGEAEAQSRIAEATEAARVQRETALRELSILANKEREVKQLLETKSQQHGAMGKEVDSLFSQHNFLLMQLHQMKKQLGL